MLKIYRAEELHDEVKLYKGINFENGVYNSDHVLGYGSIKNKRGYDTQHALYEYQNLDMENYRNIETQDGFLVDFGLWSPQNVESLEEYINKLKIVHTKKDFEKFGLNEEAILLLTSNIRLRYDNSQRKNITKIFGRWAGTAGYILLPGTEFEMGIDSVYEKNIEFSNYEVLQSKGLGKQLFLTKLDRQY